MEQAIYVNMLIITTFRCNEYLSFWHHGRQIPRPAAQSRRHSSTKVLFCLLCAIHPSPEVLTMIPQATQKIHKDLHINSIQNHPFA